MKFIERILFVQIEVIGIVFNYSQLDDKDIYIMKKFGSNKEAIVDTEAYFESKDKSFYEKGIKKLEERWNECITFEGRRVDELSRICKKIKFFFLSLVRLKTY